MNPALQKTLAFIVLIFAGYLLQKKISGKQDLKGVKILILSIILPATIFVALLKVKISADMALLPVLALALNVGLFFVAKAALPNLGFKRGSREQRTMLMLVPSLAPGLSCFPFILEYLGDAQLALAALADVGNKVFVLIILYLVAMNWYYAVRGGAASDVGKRDKLKDLGVSLLREPVNLVIVAALLMLALNLNITALPDFLGNTVARLATLMTPMVLLFIGMAVRFQKEEMATILRVLMFRSGVGFLLAAALVYAGGLTGANALLAVIFTQCACSFWPFAHMSAVEALREEGTPSVFNLDLGLNALAFSLPFSTVVILTVLSFGEVFAGALSPALAGVLMLSVPLVYVLRGVIAPSKRTERVSRAEA